MDQQRYFRVSEYFQPVLVLDFFTATCNMNLSGAYSLTALDQMGAWISPSLRSGSWVTSTHMEACSYESMVCRCISTEKKEDFQRMLVC